MERITKRSFGADDKSACPQCGAELYVSRRSPQPENSGHEVQVLSCFECSYEESRVVDNKGSIQ